MRNDTYWANRMRILEESLLDTGYEYVQNLERQYTLAIKDIEEQIAGWYQRFADENGITLAEANRLLTTKELEEFRWTVEEYIKHGQDNAVSQMWTQQLKNASARVHVSRLDSLKIQLQQQAEALHGRQYDALNAALKEVYQRGYYHTAFELQKGVGVGWTLHSIDDKAIKKVLSRPWTLDKQTFSDRIWTNKQALVNTVNTELTQSIMRGYAPDKAIKTISERFKVCRAQAGRLIMTESAAFANEARKDCFKDLGVEKYVIVETLDNETCSLCSQLDGKVYPMSEYQVGVTAPPFHPWCRGTTAPYYEDMVGLGDRAARDVKTDESFNIPKDMTYKDWKTQQDAIHGVGTVEKARTMSYNERADRAQFEKYKSRLGADAPKTFETFQKLKYDSPKSYSSLKRRYLDKGVQNRIRSNPAYTTLKVGQQGKHILGHNNYTEGRSYLTITMDEAQEIVNKYAGTGEIKRDSKGKWTHKEFVTAEKTIGYIVPEGGGEPIPTKRFSISYAVGKSKGAHIVPAKEV